MYLAKSLTPTTNLVCFVSSVCMRAVFWNVYTHVCFYMTNEVHICTSFHTYGWGGYDNESEYHNYIPPSDPILKSLYMLKNSFDSYSFRPCNTSLILKIFCHCNVVSWAVGVFHKAYYMKRAEIYYSSGLKLYCCLLCNICCI